MRDIVGKRVIFNTANGEEDGIIVAEESSGIVTIETEDGDIYKRSVWTVRILRK